MLERVRARGVQLTIGADKRLRVEGRVTALQQKQLDDHEAELLAALWREDGQTVCAWCGLTFDVHQDGVYVETGELICGACDKRGGGWQVVAGENLR